MTRGPLEIARGYEEPLVRQFSVFLPNRVGQLRELVDLFVRQGVHIVALDVVDSVDWAVVRTILSDANKARALLERSHLCFTEAQMLAVELPTLDALANLAAALLTAELNLQVIYPLMIASSGRPVVAVRVDDSEVGAQVLKARGFRLLGEPDVSAGGAESE